VLFHVESAEKGLVRKRLWESSWSSCEMCRLGREKLRFRRQRVRW